MAPKMKIGEEMMEKDIGYEEGEGLDGIIARVESYIQNPKLVTPETLSVLKEDLIDLKSVVDGEDEEAPEEGGGGLAIMIGKMRRKK